MTEPSKLEPWVADLIHDLRSAITVIGGNADLILLRNPELEELAQPIILAADRLEAKMKELQEG